MFLFINLAILGGERILVCKITPKFSFRVLVQHDSPRPFNWEINLKAEITLWLCKEENFRPDNFFQLIGEPKCCSFHRLNETVGGRKMRLSLEVSYYSNIVDKTGKKLKTKGISHFYMIFDFNQLYLILNIYKLFLKTD